MNMWIEELQEDHFRVCLREVKTFDGKHQNIQVVSWSVSGETLLMRRFKTLASA